MISNENRGAISLTCALLMVLTAGGAKADGVMNMMSDGTVFYSRKHTAKAILGNNGTEYQISSENHAPYKITVNSARLNPKRPLDLWLANGKAYLSDNGSILVWMLLPSFVGHLKLESVDSKAGGLEYVCPPEKLNRMLSQPALAFFKNGKKIKVYSLGDVLVRPELVSETGEQTAWIRPGTWTDDEKHFPREKAPSLSNDGQNFTLETTSFRKYKISTESGGIMQASDTDLWKKAKIVVWGKFIKSKNRECFLTIESAQVLKGNLPGSKLTVHDHTKSYFGFRYNLPFWTGAVLERRGKHYEITAPLWNFPMHVEPW